MQKRPFTHASPDLLDPKKLYGSHDMGVNATGVIHSQLHVTDDEIIIEETMPAAYVQQCIDEVKALSDMAKTRRPGGAVKGRIPMPIYYMWQRQWENGPKQHGVLWRAFLNSKLMDRDYSKFRVEGV